MALSQLMIDCDGCVHSGGALAFVLYGKCLCIALKNGEICNAEGDEGDDDDMFPVTT